MKGRFERLTRHGEATYVLEDGRLISLPIESAFDRAFAPGPVDICNVTGADAKLRLLPREIEFSEDEIEKCPAGEEGDHGKAKEAGE